MTREEAIIRLKEGEPYSEIYDPVWDIALNMAISALEGEWIPVTERLPENDTDVLYCSRLGTIGTCHYFNGFNNYPHTIPDLLFKDIIAWLPLPEPYKEGGEI